ncbi:hypothetical protein CORT_0D01950 [Candida orthopsilosis Co 90-125]|uniref:Uncharacterized protein n=1 Tax=Candida orthopsilosis (strain 90-125) TaxID=1136231 RepID=H8X4V1_CANO9|nr:hypothetical protein CORT_0D01950 [Candida orthopsilosis Co 90-125]CCG23043.1 hypothetical protein CORT_0D01950 [Candida orthopsilosis Co 90-125]
MRSTGVASYFNTFLLQIHDHDYFFHPFHQNQIPLKLHQINSIYIPTIMLPRSFHIRLFRNISIRQNSTTAQSYIRPKPKLYSLLKTPTTKSLILSLICTSVMIDLLKIRRDLDSLQHSYTMKLALLGEIITKLTQGDLIDLDKELKLAHAFTSATKYESVNDVELDQELEEFLKLAESDGSQEIGEQGSVGTYL